MMKLNNRALAFAAAVVLLCCTVAHGRIGAWKNPAGPVPAHCPTWDIRYTIGAMCDRWHRVFKVPNLKHPECGGKPSRCLFNPPKNACPRIPYKRCGEGMVKKYKLSTNLKRFQVQWCRPISAHFKAAGARPPGFQDLRRS